MNLNSNLIYFEMRGQLTFVKIQERMSKLFIQSLKFASMTHKKIKMTQMKILILKLIANKGMK